MARRYLSLALVLALALVSLAGCRRAAPTPTPIIVPIPTSTPTATPALAPTPTPMGTPPATAGFYENLVYGFSLSYPSQWQAQETGERAPIVQIQAPERFPLAVVTLNYLPEPVAPSEYAREAEEAMKQVVASFTLLGKGDFPQAQGYALEASWLSSQGVPMKGKFLYVIRGTQAFEIAAIGPVPRFDANQEAIYQVLTSFRLVEPQPYGIPRSKALTLFDTGPITLDPALSRESGSHSFVIQVFGGLVTFDGQLNLLPDIAQRWEVSPQGTVYTFFLRQGVKFHSGREVKAQDFKYSWERAVRPQTGSQTAETYLGDIVGVREVLQGTASELRGVRVVGDYTLEVTIDAPKSYFLAKLTYPVAFVVDRENVERAGEWWRKANGTGPFKLKEWKVDDLLVLEANSQYHLGVPKLGYVVFRLWGGIPVRMYETGEVDAAYVGRADIERVTDPANPLNRELQVIPQLSLQYLGFNAQVPPFDDPLVRQAFTMAVDKEKVINTVLKGMVQKADGILPPGLPGYNPGLKPLGFDPIRARELLRASRYKDRLPLITLTLSGEGGPVSDYVNAILQDWKQYLGVEVRVRQLPSETYFYQLKQEKDELFSTGWIADYPDPQNFLDVLFHSQSEQNFGEYSNPELDWLLEQARPLPLGPSRLEFYQEIEQKLVDDAAVLPLWFSRDYLLVKPQVKDLTISPLGLPIFKGTSLERN